MPIARDVTPAAEETFAGNAAQRALPGFLRVVGGDQLDVLVTLDSLHDVRLGHLCIWSVRSRFLACALPRSSSSERVVDLFPMAQLVAELARV
jgi:hypothetical protein